MSEDGKQSAAVVRDPWIALRNFTSARIALGRAGGSLPTADWLKFSLDHATAKDAVNSHADFDALESEIRQLGIGVLRLESQVADRAQYIQRPDLGRTLFASSRSRLEAIADSAPVDLAMVIGDGLSALAVQQHAVALLKLLLPAFNEKNIRLAPVALVQHARVAIMDEIGSLLKTRAAVILLGERPGLGAVDSLGAYLTFNPQPGNTDAQRNCVSNIRPEGLPLRDAAETLAYLVDQMLTRQISGVALKDERSHLKSLA